MLHPRQCEDVWGRGSKGVYENGRCPKDGSPWTEENLGCEGKTTGLREVEANVEGIWGDGRGMIFD